MGHFIKRTFSGQMGLYNGSATMIFSSLRASSIFLSEYNSIFLRPDFHILSMGKTRVQNVRIFLTCCQRSHSYRFPDQANFRFSFCMRFCRYTIFRSDFPDSNFVFSVLPHFCITCVPDAVPVNFTSDIAPFVVLPPLQLATK